jgi:hypothetical protein
MRAILCATLLALTITTAKADDVVFWYKQGANNIELEHTKAACEQSQLEIAIAPALAWFPVFDLCMHANGWVQIPKTQSVAPPSKPSHRP